MTIATSIIINFGSGISEGAATAELAADLNGDKTQFSPGDLVWFRLFGPPTMVVDRVRASAGAVIAMGSETVDREDTLTFGDPVNLSQSLSVYPATPVIYEWWGNTPADLVQDLQQLIVSEDRLPLIGRARYKAGARLYKLQPPPMTLAPDEEFPIVIMLEVSIP